MRLAPGREGTFVTAWLPRNIGRFEVQLSSKWVSTMHDDAVMIKANAFIRRFMQTRRCARARVTWYAQIVKPGSHDQQDHVDDGLAGRRRRCYYTVILPLTNAPKQGGTYFVSLGRAVTNYGGVCVHRGDVVHHGQGNRSSQPRCFLYAVICEGTDHN